MKIFFHNEFRGRWPVGTSAVVVAKNSVRAATLLEIELTECGLEQKISPEDMNEVPTSRETVYILQDGEY